MSGSNIIGDFAHIFSRNVFHSIKEEVGVIPETAFYIFQLMFAATSSTSKRKIERYFSSNIFEFLDFSCHRSSSRTRTDMADDFIRFSLVIICLRFRCLLGLVKSWLGCEVRRTRFCWWWSRSYCSWYISTSLFVYVGSTFASDTSWTEPTA